MIDGQTPAQRSVAWQAHVHDLVYGAGREAWQSGYNTGYRDGLAAAPVGLLTRTWRRLLVWKWLIETR